MKTIGIRSVVSRRTSVSERPARTFLSRTVKRTVGLMYGPSTGAVAVAQARNISGGVNPSVKLPAAPQPFGSRGPLSRLLGGHLSLIARSRELAYNRLFTTVNTISLRASAFWNVCCSTGSGQDRHTWPVIAGGGKDHHLRFTDPRTYSTRPNTLSEELCAFSYAKEVVNITDEPALVAEPGWLLSSRLAR